MKKTKLLLSLAMMCLSVAVLCFGVLASNSVDYSISGNISYEVQDAYVKITSNLYKTDAAYAKASDFKLDAQKIESNASDKPTLGTATLLGQYDSLSQTGSATNTNKTISYNLNSTPVVRTNWIVTTIENMSTTELYIKITDNQEMDFITANSFIYRSNDVLQVNAKSTVTTVIGYTLYNPSRKIDSTTLYGYKFSIGLKDNYSPLKYQAAQNLSKMEYGSGTYSKAAYYYVEMGDFYGLPIRWKLIATKTTDTTGNGVYSGYKHFDGTTTPPTNSEGIFMQETNISTVRQFHSSITSSTGYEKFLYTERSDDSSVSLIDCSFNNRNGDVKTEDDGTVTSYNANNYYYSKVRQYLTQTTTLVNKYSSGTTASATGDKSNLVTDLSIDTSSGSIYDNIIPRTSMSTKTGKFVSNIWTTNVTTDSNYGDQTAGLTFNDRFWLLSLEEIITWKAGVTLETEWDDTQKAKAIWGYKYSSTDAAGTYFWTRSGSSVGKSAVLFINCLPDNNYSNNPTNVNYAARSAFMLAL